MIDLSVIVVSYNTQKLLRDCLASIFKQTKDLTYEVIVVDNASTDGSLPMVKKIFPKVLVIENKENLGFSKANNQALRLAQGKAILLLNSDTKVVGHALKKLIDFAETKEKLAVVGPKLLNADGSRQPSTAPFLKLPRALLWLATGDRFLYASPAAERKVDWVMGAALLVKKEVVAKVGGLDEQFFMYLEEVEWCYRIKKAGWQVWFYPGAEVYHLVRGSSPEGKQRAVMGIYTGLPYFYGKHYGKTELAVLKLALRTKAILAWGLGILTGNRYLKETYAKAFKVVG